MEQLFKDRKSKIDVFKSLRKPIVRKQENKPDVPEGLYIKCSSCKATVLRQEVRNHGYSCPQCGKLFRLSAKGRLKLLCDEKSFTQIGEKLESKNPLEFEGYEEKLNQAKEKTGIKEAIICGTAKINGSKCAIGVMDSNFMMASMGHVVGERITMLIELAIKKKLPLILVCCSGGARMQEGIISLMQMAKTSAALAKLNEAGNLYISVLSDPTTGGVSASFAMLGDIILAEPQALIGFAGPRVIKQTINADLPEGFQTSEFLLEKGFIDKVVPRSELKNELGKLLKLHERN